MRDFRSKGVYAVEIEKNKLTIYWQTPDYDKPLKMVNPSRQQCIDLIRCFNLKPASPADGIVMGRYFLEKVMRFR